jgi:peroxiredoxin
LLKLNYLRMKIQIISIISIVLFFSCKPSTPLQESNYTVNVKAEGVYNGLRGYLVKLDRVNSRVLTDTAIVYNGAFTFKGKSNGTEMRGLIIDGLNGQVPFVLEPGEIEIEVFKDSLNTSTISGTKNNSVFNAYKRLTLQKQDDIKAIRVAIYDAKGNPALIKSLQQKGDSLRKDFKLYGFKFIENHSNAEFSLLMLNELTRRNNFDYELATEAFESIDAALKTKNKTNQDISYKIGQKLQNNPNKNKITIGVKAPDFSAPNPEGKVITLSEIKGKVIIVDFWASWCKPCRMENPNLVKLYDTYHSKGLEIISVSLDGETQKEAWIKAIEKDQLNWFNVSNLKSWQDPIARTYGINSIPATFILDETGTVIAERLRGAELEVKIKALLD